MSPLSPVFDTDDAIILPSVVVTDYVIFVICYITDDVTMTDDFATSFLNQK